MQASALNGGFNHLWPKGEEEGMNLELLCSTPVILTSIYAFSTTTYIVQLLASLTKDSWKPSK